MGAAAEVLGRAGARRKVVLWMAETMGVSPLDPDGSRRAQRRALQSALNNDVAVYVIDPRENRGIDDPINERRTGGTMRVGPGATTLGGGAGGVLTLGVDDMAAVPLTQITRETGGRYITDANDLDLMLADIIEQNATSYVLTYESPRSREPGEHRIEVHVKRPQSRVFARRGYFVDAQVAGAGTDVAMSPHARLLRDTVLGSVPQGTLPITAHVAPRFAHGGQGSAVVTIRLDPVGKRPEPIDLLLATVDDAGRVANQRQVRMTPPPEGAPWEVTAELEVPRGHYQVRVAAVTADAADTGLVLASLEIVEPGRDLAMTPPVLLARTGGHVHPTAARQFFVGDAFGVQADVGGRAVERDAVTVRASLIDELGASSRQADAVLDPVEKADHKRVTALVTTEGLAAGTYTLLLEADETSNRGARTVRHAIPIALATRAVSRASRTGTAVRHTVVAHGPSSRHDAPGAFVMRTEEEWRAFWSRLPTRQAPPDIDFARVTLLAVVSDTGTATPAVSQVIEADGVTLVHWSAAKLPAEGDAGSRPFVVVGLVEHESARIVFERVTITQEHR